MDGMRISELSARSGVPTSTLRYYEAEGLLPAERAGNGYRVYGSAAVDRLAFIAQAKHLDLPLSSVRELVDAWESEPCQSVRAKYRPMLAERAAQVDERRVALDALRTTLTTAIERLDALPDRDQPCDAGCTFLGRARPALPIVSARAEPIACSLGSGDYSARIEEWRDLLADAPRVDVDGGVRATLPTTTLERAAALAAAEQGCCAFYAIRIDLHGPTFDLTVTAPPEAADMLAELLPTTGSAAR
ncbi:MerR family transcriptional regulator [Promicromonospora panici]|uniref:MerR family transcriptional regulator n=1 Tax=Promicromonospora panici TaxID=2219658 RepID=UPI0013ED0A00|nr:MerR family transcriptional regulator [Promicromonospora panici]